MLVEPLRVRAVAERPQVVGEPLAGNVKVEEARPAGPLVAERVHDAGRRGDEGASGCAHDAPVGPELEEERALEDVQRVRVAAVDVRVGPPLAWFVARFRDRDRVEVGFDDDGALGALLEDLAATRLDENGLHVVGTLRERPARVAWRALSRGPSPGGPPVSGSPASSVRSKRARVVRATCRTGPRPSRNAG